MTSSAAWALSQGATLLPDGSVQFSVWAPQAQRVAIVLTSGRGERCRPLEPVGGGHFTGLVTELGPGTEYFYQLDDGQPRPDPVSRYRPAGVHGPTRVVDPAEYRWSDAGWPGIATADLAIYELHVGTFTPAGSFDSVIERLADLRALGITALEIMPVAEFPDGRNWGYDGVSLYAAQSSYGGPEGLRRLVDACHQEGLAVILDVVYNHLGPEGNYLPEFGPYFSDRHQTAWGPGWNLDGPQSNEVRRYLVDNALYWQTEFHVDGLRLDAADKIVDHSATHILDEISSAVRRQAQAFGRRFTLIAESDANEPRFVRTPEQRGYGLDAQWSDDFHHAVHVALTGEQQGYFAEFGGVAPVAKVMAEPPATDIPADRFVVCIQNHDQVGNRAAGERLSTLVRPDALRLGAAALLLSPYVPLLFMGEEYAESNPFLYFVSYHDPALVAAVRAGRRREFAAFGWTGEVPDPQSETTFARCRLDWSRREAPGHSQLRALYTDLLQLRRTEPALRPGAARVSADYDERERWVRVYLTTARSRVCGLFNFADGERRVSTEPLTRLVLSTDDPRYGGEGRTLVRDGEVSVPALSASLVRIGTV